MNGLHLFKIKKHRVRHGGIVFARIIIIILQSYFINSWVSRSYVIAGYNRKFEKLLASFIGYPKLFWLVNPNYFFVLFKYIKCARR